MEYPTLFTGDTSWYEPTYITEITAEHEFGHQYWYGMVATNEFEDAWLDEGINSYTEVNVLAAILGRETSVFDRPYANAGDYETERLEYIAKPGFDPVTRWAYKFRDSSSYGGVTYGKTATLLATLEGIIGRDTMDDAMHRYFMRYRFTHPTTEDFLRTIEETAIAHGKAKAFGAASTGAISTAEILNTFIPPPPFSPSGEGEYATTPATNSSLRYYFNQAVYGTEVLDYAVDGVSSDPVEWWLPEPKDKTKIQYRSTVYIHRKGDFILPVTAEIVFDDGTRLREHWNGVDRWIKWTYTRNAKIASVEIDPDHTVILDKDFFNNSYRIEGNGVAARKLTNIWMSAVQLLAQLSTWIV